MVTRSTVVTAALAAAAALAATGITYASAASSEPAQAAPVVQQATAPVSALNGEAGGGDEDKGGNGNGGNDNGGNDNGGNRNGGNDNGGNDNGGNDNGGNRNGGNDEGGYGNGGNDEGGNDEGGYGKGGNDEGGYGKGGNDERRGERRHFLGRIHINERTYPAVADGCITVVSGLGSKSLNIRNDSHKTVEIFRGATCDNGAPLATVGPWSSSDGVRPGRVKGGVKVHHGVVGSFRVIRHHGGFEKGGFEKGGFEEGGFEEGGEY